MTASIAQEIAFVAGLSVKAAAVFGAGALLLLALRRSSASLRHRAGTWVIWSAAALPIAAFVLPGFELPVLPARAAELRTLGPSMTLEADTDVSPAFIVAPSRASRQRTHERVDAIVGLATNSVVTLRHDAALVRSAVAQVSAILPAPLVPSAVKASRWHLFARLRKSLERLMQPITVALLLALSAGFVWLLGAALLWARLISGLRRVARLTREGVRADPEWEAMLARSAAKLGLDPSRPVRLLIHPEVPVAMTAGSSHPVVLLPASAATWSEDRRRVVLLHELAHIRRDDWLQLISSEIALGVWWFHPLAWWMSRSVRRDAEQAADDLVLAAGTRPSDYAAHLLEIVRGLRDGETAPRPAMAMAQLAGIEERVRSILDGRRRRGLGVMQGRALGLALGAAVLALAVARPTAAHANDVSPASVQLVTAPAPSHATAKVLVVRALPAPRPSPSPAPNPTPFARPQPRVAIADEAPRAPLPPLAPIAPRAPRAPEAPEAAIAPDAPEVPEAAIAPDAPEAPEALIAPDAPEAPEAADTLKFEVAPAPAAPYAPTAPRAPLAPVPGFAPLAPMPPMPALPPDAELSAQDKAQLRDLARATGKPYSKLSQKQKNELRLALAARNYERSAREYSRYATEYPVASEQAERDDAQAQAEAMRAQADAERAEMDAQRAAMDAQRRAIAKADQDLVHGFNIHLNGTLNGQAIEKKLHLELDKAGVKLAGLGDKLRNWHSRDDNDDGDEEEDYYNRGMRLHRRGRYQDAIAAFQKAIDADQRPDDASYNIACDYAQLNDVANSIVWLKKAADEGFDVEGSVRHDDDFDPVRDDPKFRAGLQELRSQRGDRHSAEAKAIERRLERLEKRNPKSSEPWSSIARELLDAGAYDQAFKAYSAAAERSSNPGTSLYNAACALSLKGDKSAALDQLQKAIEGGFDDVHQIKTDDDLDAIHDDPRFKELLQLGRDLELDVDRGSFQLNFGSVHIWSRKSNKRRSSDDLAHYQEMAKKHANLGRAQYNLGYAQLNADDTAGAEASFTKAASMGYRKGASLYNTACAQARQGHKDAAFKSLKDASDAGFDVASAMSGDDDLESLHGDARYRQLKREAGDKSDHDDDDDDE